MKKKLPSVTFVICTFNSQNTIGECLESIKKLDYPKNLIKAQIMDGESRDKTLEIVKKYSFCKVIIKKTDGPEIATAMGYNRATTDLVVNFPSDNVIRERNWLRRMVQPLLDNTKIVAVETLYYSYVKGDKPLNRYFGLFGMNDPVALYLNKRDRAAHFETHWHLPTPYQDKGDYFVTNFTTENMPTLGANGFVIRRKFAQLVSKVPEKFSHIDSCYDLVKSGHTTFAFVKNDIWHKTGEDFFTFLKKRNRYLRILYLNKIHVRRYHLYNPQQDKVNLLKYIFFSLTFVEPTAQSIRGFIKIRDWAWFFHPLVCFSLTIVYTYAFVLNFLQNKWRKN